MLNVVANTFQDINNEVAVHNHLNSIVAKNRSITCSKCGMQFEDAQLLLQHYDPCEGNADYNPYSEDILELESKGEFYYDL